MLNNIPLTTIPRWKYTTSIVFAFLLISVGLYYTYKYVYTLGAVYGMEAYHAQCLTGGIIVDSEGQAVLCGPLSKASQAEKESFKDKVNAPSLFN